MVLPATIQDVIGMRGGHRPLVLEVQLEFTFEVQHRTNKCFKTTSLRSVRIHRLSWRYIPKIQVHTHLPDQPVKLYCF